VNEEVDKVLRRRKSVRMEVPAAWNDLTESIIGGAIEVHRALGPGLLEKIYEEALDHELRLRGFAVERQKLIRLEYKGIQLPEQKLDMLINGLVVVELKSCDGVSDMHLAQLVSYLRAADAPLGLIINFNTMQLTNGVHRRINPYATTAVPHQIPVSSVSL